MVNSLFSDWNFHNRSLSLYLGFSVVASLLILGSTVSYTDWPHFSHGILLRPFAVCFFVMNFHVLIRLGPYSRLWGIDQYLLGFFLFQFSSLLIMGFEQVKVDYFYMATIPIVAILFGIQSDKKRSNRFKLRMGLITMALGTCSFLSLMIHPEFSHQWPTSVILLMAFCTWQIGTIYLANIEWMRISRETLVSVLKNHRSDKGDYTVHPEEKERYFFHDIINHTHGMGLLLRYRLMKNRGLTYEETLSFSNELEALQELVKDHFGLNHKNLIGQETWKNFNELKNLTYNLVHSYFPDNQVESFFLFRGSLSEELDNNPLLPFVAYHRIVTNMIKNCAEAGSRKMEVIFDGNQTNLKLTIKNDVYKNHSQGYDLSKKLEYMITNEAQQSSKNGVGLESIESLSRSFGGEFHFYIENGFWVNEVTLPFKEKISNASYNHSKSHIKKAS